MFRSNEHRHKRRHCCSIKTSDRLPLRCYIDINYLLNGNETVILFDCVPDKFDKVVFIVSGVSRHTRLTTWHWHCFECVCG